MSVTEQEKLIESMASLDEKGQTYLMGVMAGLVAMQRTSSVSCADTTRACRPVLRSDRATGAICGTLRTPEGEGTTGCCGKSKDEGIGNREEG